LFSWQNEKLAWCSSVMRHVLKANKMGVENLGALLQAVVDMDTDGISASGTVRTMYANC